MTPEEINAKAIDILDGNIPPIDWRDMTQPELLRRLCQHIEIYERLKTDFYAARQLPVDTITRAAMEAIRDDGPGSPCVQTLFGKNLAKALAAT